MQAVLQIKAVKNRQVVVQLPEDFPLTDRVEVIILPAPSLESEIVSAQQEPEELETLVIPNFLAMDLAQFTSDQRQAYERLRKAIQTGPRPNEPRTLGLFEGLIQITEDFDAPLTDEDLFWGNSTDESGISLEP